MHNFVHDMLHASPAARRIEALWEVRPRPPFMWARCPIRHTDALTPPSLTATGIRTRHDSRGQVRQRHVIRIGYMRALFIPTILVLTPPSKWLVFSDLDRLEMVLQGTSCLLEMRTCSMTPTAREYEKAHKRDRRDLQCFFDSSLPYLRHRDVRQWGDALVLERDRDLPMGGDDRDGA